MSMGTIPARGAAYSSYFAFIFIGGYIYMISCPSNLSYMQVNQPPFVVHIEIGKAKL